MKIISLDWTPSHGAGSNHLKIHISTLKLSFLDRLDQKFDIFYRFCITAYIWRACENCLDSDKQLLLTAYEKLCL